MSAGLRRRAVPSVAALAPFAIVLALAGCNREAPPTYAPPPPPDLQPAYVPPPQSVAPGEEKLVIARACAPDIERFCAGVPPRQGMIKGCMKSHLTELSAGCFDAVMGAIASQHAP